MTATARRLDVEPAARELAKRVATLEEQRKADAALLVELQQTVASLLAERDAAAAIVEDGAPRPPGRWRRMKEAMKATGYSESGLRRLCDLGRCAWDYEGPHRVIDVTTVPRRSAKVLKVHPGAE
jgi:hypothetical protein